jgi:hypothetical protein
MTRFPEAGMDEVFGDMASNFAMSLTVTRTRPFTARSLPTVPSPSMLRTFAADPRTISRPPRMAR